MMLNITRLSGLHGLALNIDHRTFTIFCSTGLVSPGGC